MSRWTFSRAKWSTVLGLVALSLSVGAQDRYQVIDLGAPSGTLGSRPNKISSNGAIVGESYPGLGISSIWIWVDGTMSELGVLGTDITAHVYGINRNSIVLGSSGIGADEKGFIWDNGMTQIFYVKPDPILVPPGIPPPDGYPDNVEPLRGIEMNDNGQMIYSGLADTGAWMSFWENPFDAPNALPYNPAIIKPSTGGESVFALAINGPGRVVGRSEGAEVKAFRWTPPPVGTADGQFNEIQVKRQGDTFCEAVDLNDLDFIIGTTGFYFRPQLGAVDYYLPASWIFDATGNFLCEQRTYLAGLPGDFLTEAREINNNGQMVGRSGRFTANLFTGTYDWRGVIWYPGVCVDDPLLVSYEYAPIPLDDLIPPGSPYKILEATAINDLGQVTAVAAINGEVRSVLLNPIRFPTSLSLFPNRAAGGTPIQATVVIDRPAPPGGVTLDVTSSNPTYAQAPATVTVPSGQTSAQFTVTTVGVLNFTGIVIRVSAAGHTRSAQLSLLKTTPLSLTVSSPTTGGVNTDMTIRLNGRAPAGGLLVNLSSNMPSVASVPTPVRIAAGEVERTITVRTYPTTVNRVVRFLATANGVTRAADLLVKSPFLADLILFSDQVQGGDPVTGQVKLSYFANSGGANCTVFSSNPSVASVPNPVTVPAGSKIRNFIITTAPVSFTTNVTITATFNGGTRTRALLVEPGK